MIIIESLISLLLLLTFFSIMGLGVTQGNFAKKNLALVPVLGYAAVLGLAYIISANFKISGGSSVACAIILLTSSFLIRIRGFAGLAKTTYQNNELYMFLAVTAIPILTLILPGILIGFKYFFADVNYDFFYNCQDSWFLQTHNVLQFGDSTPLFGVNKAPITPLTWSANFAGRIGISLLGAFFPQWLHLNILHFNSLLLNTIVILFALAMSSFCKDFFKLRNKATLVAVFFSIASAGYVQAYCYYVLGQISVVPVFVVFCIFLKRFFDSIFEKSTPRNILKNSLITGLLLNVIFILYAIMSFFAGCIAVLSYVICFRKQLNKNTLTPLIKMILIAIGLFCVVRLTTVPETIHIIKSWVALSSHVAQGVHDELFIVFSEYLTTAFLSIFFGLATYPTAYSFFAIEPIAQYRVILLIVFGIGALLTTLLALNSFAKSKEDPNSARAIIITLLGITIISAFYFFFSLSGYGIFKLQSWFLPILTPLYIYIILKPRKNKIQIILKLCCAIILALNVYTGTKYLKDFFATGVDQRFVNAHGITANKDLLNIVDKLKSSGVSEISLFLTTGLETAWFADSLRNFKLNTVIHNNQPLQEKDPDQSACASQDQNWHPSGLMIITNPNSSLYEITPPLQGGKVIYSTNSYSLIDLNNLQSITYIGTGSYPIEHFSSPNSSFPEKFRWVEKSVEIVIYTNKDKAANLSVEVTPGYVDNKNLPRNFFIKTNTGEHKYTIESKTTMTIPNVKLHQGLNCIVVGSPDHVSKLVDHTSFLRGDIPMDPRLLNFAISNVKLS